MTLYRENKSHLEDQRGCTEEVTVQLKLEGEVSQSREEDLHFSRGHGSSTCSNVEKSQLPSRNRKTGKQEGWH